MTVAVTGLCSWAPAARGKGGSCFVWCWKLFLCWKKNRQFVAGASGDQWSWDADAIEFHIVNNNATQNALKCTILWAKITRAPSQTPLPMGRGHPSPHPIPLHAAIILSWWVFVAYLEIWNGGGVHFRCTFSKVFKINFFFHIKN